MSLVGQFPGLENHRRRTIRAAVNPLDKSTVVSILPKEIDEYKCTIQPGRFIIAPGTYEKPAVLVVGPSSWWKELDDNQPLLEIPQSSIAIADSVVKDYCNGILGCNMGDAMPGLFYVMGNFTSEEIKTKFKELVDAAKIKQDAWFKVLVQMADTLWARTNGNPLTISSDMRMAAKMLNLENNKEWTKDSITSELVRCKACGALKNQLYPVCGSCKAIDNPELAKSLGLTFVK